MLVEDEHRRLHMTNQRFCDWFGVPVPPEALRGADCAAAAAASAVTFRDPEAFLAQVEQTLEAATPVVGVRIDLADGRVFERDYMPIWLDGTYRGHLWQYRDITERSRAERRVRESRDALRYLLDLVRHEVASPLTALRAAADQLGRTRLDAEQAAAVDTLTAASLALEHAVLESVGRAEYASGTGEIRPRDGLVRVDQVIEEAIALIRAAAQAKGLALASDSQALACGAVRGDRGLLRQVLVNLLQNAVRYTDAGGVRVVASCQGVSDGRLWLDVAVHDTGRGVPTDDQARIFESRERGSNVAHGSGHGLGLALCRRIAGAMGGTLELSSSSERGSVFALRVPMVPALPPGDGRLDGVRVLIVDDDPTIRRYLAHFLAQAGARLSLADGVASARTTLRSEVFDVALVDVSLGDGRLVDLLDAISDTRAGTRVLLLSGHVGAVVDAALEGRAVSARLQKPIAIDEVIHTLRAALVRGPRGVAHD